MMNDFVAMERALISMDWAKLIGMRMKKLKFFIKV